MRAVDHPISSLSLALQILVLGSAPLFLALYPPERGRMILIPLLPGAERGMIGKAVEGGALLIGGGPLPNSMVVEGDRAELAETMLERGVLVLAAPPAGCGSGTSPGDKT